MPVLLLRLLEQDSLQYQPPAALSASILEQAPGSGATRPPEGPPEDPPDAPPEGPSEGSPDKKTGPGPKGGKGAGLGSGTKLGVGLAAAALVVVGALLLRGGEEPQPSAIPPAPSELEPGNPAPGAPEPPEAPDELPEEPTAQLPPVGGLGYTQAFNDGAGYVHVIIPGVPQDAATLHLYAAPGISEDEAAETIAEWEANQGWGNQWMPNSAMGNEDGSYAASLRHPDETGGDSFDLLVASFNEDWQAVSYDILHVTVS